MVIFDAQTPLVNICRRLGDISGAIEHCETAIQAFREVLPWQIMEISDYYYNLGELYSDKARGVGQGSVKFAKKLKEKVFFFFVLCNIYQFFMILLYWSFKHLHIVF